MSDNDPQTQLDALRSSELGSAKEEKLLEQLAEQKAEEIEQKVNFQYEIALLDGNEFIGRIDLDFDPFLFIRELLVAKQNGYDQALKKLDHLEWMIKRNIEHDL